MPRVCARFCLRGSIGQSVTFYTSEPKNVGYRPVCMDNGAISTNSSAKE